MIWVILVVLVLLTFLYINIVKPYNYWTDRGVKQRKQVYLLGDNADVFLRRESMFDTLIKIYNAFPEERYCGIYQTTFPALLLRDPELIRQITIQEFNHFVDHRRITSTTSGDQIWSRNLLALRGKKWRNMRSTLSPSFTSSKMRTMFGLIFDVANDCMTNLRKNNETATVELKDLFTRYTSDVIASVAFGVKCDSFNDRGNEFYTMGRTFMNVTLVRSLIFIAYNISPKLCQAIGLQIFPQAITNFFSNLVKETIKIREEQGIVRQDMIQLLVDARKNKKGIKDDQLIDGGLPIDEEPPNTTFQEEEITDMDIAAQALIFFLGGFESVSTTLSFMGYELVVNPDIQERLQREIDETMEESKGILTYEALLKMKYLDMVISETLRKWPTTFLTDRECTQSFTIDPLRPNEKAVYLKSGDSVWIPINAIHHDPNNYQNPDKFDPDRFSDVNKENIKPYTYLPFGLGPRHCIGSRFALLEMKTIFCHLLYNFDLIVVQKTDIPLKLKAAVSLTSENGIWVGLKLRFK